jgi:hypothetical protein
VQLGARAQLKKTAIRRAIRVFRIVIYALGIAYNDNVIIDLLGGMIMG